MNHASKSPKSMAIAKGSLHSARAFTPLFVTVESGRLWVTFDGEIRDFIVTAGESILIPRGKHAVFQALDATQIAILERVPMGRDEQDGARSDDVKDRSAA